MNLTQWVGSQLQSKKKVDDRKQTVIQLPEKLRAWVHETADALGVSPSSFIERSLEEARSTLEASKLLSTPEQNSTPAKSSG